MQLTKQDFDNAVKQPCMVEHAQATTAVRRMKIDIIRKDGNTLKLTWPSYTISSGELAEMMKRIHDPHILATLDKLGCVHRRSPIPVALLQDGPATRKPGSPDSLLQDSPEVSNPESQ